MSTSKLQIAVGEMLDSTFPEYRIRENYRPEWLRSSNLTKLELDFYIEELKIAFEVQGAQHFEFIPHFHRTIDKFEQRKQYDEEKRDLCYGVGVKLIEVCTLMDAMVQIKTIADQFVPQLGEWIECTGVSKPKKTKKVKEIKTKRVQVILKEMPVKREYSFDELSKEKAKEMKQFLKKQRKHQEKYHTLVIPHFDFKFLSLDEQIALFHGAEIPNVITAIDSGIDLKIKEIEQFKTRIRKTEADIIKFDFRYLTSIEQSALSDELGVKVIPRSQL